jgi:cytochrome c-type biogenesis protein CcmH/NrfG
VNQSTHSPAVADPADSEATIASLRAQMAENPAARRPLATALMEARRWQEAIPVLESLLADQQGDADSAFKLGNALRHLDRPEAALAAYDHVLRINPTSAEAHLNRASILVALGRPDLALGSYDAALRARPTYSTARYSRGMALLQMGRFVEGWVDYAWRFGDPAGRPVPVKLPEWQGEAERTVLVLAEQGFGDLIQFVRFIPWLESRAGCRPLLACDARMIGLLGGFREKLALHPLSSPLPPADCYTPLLSLPRHFSADPYALPLPRSYLKADPARLDKWHGCFDSRPGFRVGIVWQGNPDAEIDKGRSYPLAAAAPIARLDGVRLIAFQQRHGLDQLETLPADMSVERPPAEVDGDGNAFADTAALLRQIDLLVTSDTAMAHLAGALGVPAWVALKAVPEWRWGLGGDVTPWYGSLRLFRQHRRGDWSGVFEEMAGALGELLAARR